MDFAVPIQHSLRHKSLVTSLTLIRLIPSMVPPVYHQRRVLRKSFAAGLAHVRLLARMRPLVSHQGCPLMKSLPTNITNQTFVPTVQSQMVL